MVANPISDTLMPLVDTSCATVATYGNGRMGTRAWTSYAGTDRALSTPYHVDLFSVYLWRLVSFDLAEATARARNPNSAALDPHIKRHLGIGNSSGLGTVAAVQRWPARFAAAVL